MSDLAEMLGIVGDSNAPTQSKDAVNLIQSFQKQKSLTKQKKVKSKVSREVLDLIGKDGNLNDTNSHNPAISNLNGTISDGAELGVSFPQFKKKRTTSTQNEVVKSGWVWTRIPKVSDGTR